MRNICGDVTIICITHSSKHLSPFPQMFCITYPDAVLEQSPYCMFSGTCTNSNSANGTFSLTVSQWTSFTHALSPLNIQARFSTSRYKSKRLQPSDGTCVEQEAESEPRLSHTCFGKTLSPFAVVLKKPARKTGVIECRVYDVAYATQIVPRSPPFHHG
jgi:hypothetical protein